MYMKFFMNILPPLPNENNFKSQPRKQRPAEWLACLGLGFGLFLLVAEVLDTHVFHLALEPSGLMHRTNTLVREPVWILLATLAVCLLWCSHHRGTG